MDAGRSALDSHDRGNERRARPQTGYGKVQYRALRLPTEQRSRWHLNRAKGIPLRASALSQGEVGVGQW